MIKNLTLDKIYQNLLIILAFLMPLSVSAANTIITIICLLWLLSGKYKEKFNAPEELTSSNGYTETTALNFYIQTPHKQ